ncbi:MAG: hypothetical protein AAF532_15990 [Planctomycetota bacterium]
MLLFTHRALLTRAVVAATFAVCAVASSADEGPGRWVRIAFPGGTFAELLERVEGLHGEDLDLRPVDVLADEAVLALPVPAFAIRHAAEEPPGERLLMAACRGFLDDRVEIDEVGPMLYRVTATGEASSSSNAELAVGDEVVMLPVGPLFEEYDDLAEVTERLDGLIAVTFDEFVGMPRPRVRVHVPSGVILAKGRPGQIELLERAVEAWIESTRMHLEFEHFEEEFDRERFEVEFDREREFDEDREFGDDPEFREEPEFPEERGAARRRL